MRHHKILSVMTPAADVISVGVGTPYKEIARLLAEHEISAVPVLDPQSRVCGVVSEADLLLKESRAEPRKVSLFAGREEDEAQAKAAGTTALDLMSSPAVTVGPDEDVARAARLMEDRHVKRLPVVDEDGRLAGIVSRRDILGLFVRPDDEIRSEIVEDLLLKTLWVDPSGLDIRVEEGVVTLRGEVETLSLADLIGRLVLRADGVVDVVNQLGYARDDSEDRLSPGRLHGVFERRRPGT